LSVPNFKNPSPVVEDNFRLSPTVKLLVVKELANSIALLFKVISTALMLPVKSI